MRQIVKILKGTGGRPQDIEAPSEGWTYEALGELPKGTYHVTLGDMLDEAAPGGDAMPEDAIAAGHTFAILARSSVSWDLLVRRQQATIDQQAKLIVQLYTERGKLLDNRGDGAQSPLEMLASFAPLAKALLADGKGKDKPETPDGK